MSIDLKAVLKNKAINEWRLFWLISVPMSLVIAIEMLGTDISTGPGVSTMIGYSVRFAVPFIFLVVAASSVQILFPGPFPMWWLRNRKYHRDVFCRCDGMARRVHFHDVGVFPRVLLRRHLFAARRTRRKHRLHLPCRHGGDVLPRLAANT